MECNNVFCINSATGKLGIGTTNPTAKLEVMGSIKADNVGTVFIRWGNASAPAGTTLLYSGYAFNDYAYAVGNGNYPGGGVDAICVKPGDYGQPSGSNYGDLLWTVATGGASYMPSGITPTSEIKCAVIYAPGPTFEMWGTWNCPSGWTAAYTGYGMGAWYLNYNPSKRHCVDNVNFDASVKSTTQGDVWYGTILWSMDDLPADSGYTAKTYVKCAVCYKQ